MSTQSLAAPHTHEQRIAGWLTQSEFATLEAICETLLPSLAAPAGSAPQVASYYQRSARDLGVALRLAEMLGRDTPQVHHDLRQFLAMFRRAALSLLLVGAAKPFAELSQPEREQYLLWLANSPVGVLRKGFQGIKRLACMIFYTNTNAQGINPNWEVLDYTPPTPPPAVAPAMQPTAIHQDMVLEADAVVIGSGAGGSVVAAELAQAGKHVIVLEKGGYNYEGNFTHLEQQAMSEMFLKQGAMASSDLGMLIMAGSTLGGGTVINWMTCFRPQQDVLTEWETVSGLAGQFTGAALQRSFAAVEERLNVSRYESAHNGPNRVLFEGASALGLHADVIPRNARDCNGRCEGCNFGCRHGASQSTLKTYLQDAYEHGAQLLVRCSAERVLTEGGQVRGVVALAQDPETGRQHRVQIHARTVVVAAGALHTPALLLRSGLENPHIGRHLRMHPTTVSVGLYPEKINAWRGALQSAYSDAFTHLDGAYGYKLEAAPGHPGLFALARPWASAHDYREQMIRGAHLAPIIIVVRDRGEGQVRLDERGDPLVDYAVSAYDRNHMAHGLRQMARIHFAAGADEVMTLQNKPTYVERSSHSEAHAQHLRTFDRQVERHGLEPNRILTFSAHQMGSCRMGANPADSVTDGSQQVHGVRGLYICDSSVFPNASGVNPMLSIMGLAHHASQHIRSTMP